MNLQEIKDAVRNGKPVYWKNPAYKVIVDIYDQWMIIFKYNNSAVGLTLADGVTLSARESDFFIDEPPVHTPEPTADDFADLDAIAYGAM